MQEEAIAGSNPDIETKPGVVKGPFDWRVVLIALYLFILLLVSINWLSGLMMANTTGLDDKGNKIVACTANLGSGCVVTATGPSIPPGNSSNTNGATANVAPTVTPTSNTNTAAPSNTANSNRPANANTRPAGNSASNTDAATSTTPDAKRTVNSSNTNTNANTAVSRPSDLAEYVVIKNPGLFGSWLSICDFCESGCISGDGFLFLLVLFAGMIGAIIRSLTYLGWYVGNGKFSIAFVWYYLFQPFFGGALALIFYVVLRGGFGSGTIGKNNIYAFAAVAFLSGLFTENVMAKLKLIAESILVSTEKPKPPKPNGGGAPADSQAGGAVNKPEVTGTPPRNIGKDEPPV